MHAQNSPASIRMNSKPCSHRSSNGSNYTTDHEKITNLLNVFGETNDDEPEIPPPKRKKRDNDISDEQSKYKDIEKMRLFQLQLVHDMLSKQYEKVDFSINSEQAKSGKFVIQTDAGLEVNTKNITEG